MPINDQESIELQLGIINPASSKDMMDKLNEVEEQSEFYNQLSEIKGDVTKLKDMLSETPPEDVTVELAEIVDKNLSKLGVKLPEEVEGAECLGFTLMPKDYLATRIQGCESFLDKISDWGKKTITDFFTMVSDKFVLVKEGHKSLLKRTNMVESKANGFKGLAGTKTFSIERYAHLLHKDGVVPSDLDVELKKLYMTVKGLLSNYYRVNQSNTNEILSFFGHFHGLEEPEALQRLLMLPKAISRYEFKDAMIPVKDLSKPDSVTRSSVKMLGGTYFLNSILIVRKELKNLEELHDWVVDFKDKECIRLHKDKFEPKGDYVIASLGKKEILTITKVIKDTLDEMNNLYVNGDKYIVGDKEYLDMIKQIKDNPWTRAFGEVILDEFTNLVLARNVEQIKLRSEITGYLTLLMNALLNVCEMSMEE